MNRSRKVRVTVLAASVLLPASAHAAVQRMGFIAGTYDIASHATSAVQVFCLDFTRDSPSVGDNFNHVLTDTRDATVTLGSQRMPLQQALDKGLLKMEGRHPDFDEFLIGALSDDIPTDQRAEFRAQLTALRQLAKEDFNNQLVAILSQGHSAAEQAKLRARFAQLHAAYNRENRNIGDFRSIDIKNLTPYDAKISLDKNTIVGTANETTADIGSAFRSAKSAGEDHDAFQHRVWEAGEKSNLAMLADSGFPPAPPAKPHVKQHVVPSSRGGANSPEFEHASVRKFQKAFGLKVTGEIDANTRTKLTEVAANSRELATINARRDRGYLAATLHTRDAAGGRTGYSVDFGGGSMARGNLPLDVYRSVTTAASHHGAKHVYLSPMGATRNEILGLATSFRNFAQSHPDAPEIFIYDLDGQTIGGDPYLGKPLDAGDVHESGEPTLVTLDDAVGAHQLAYSQSIDLKTRDGVRVRLTVTARAKEVLTRFFEHLRAVIAGLRGNPSLTQATMADVVNAAFLRTARDFHWTPQQASKNLRAQIGLKQVADLLITGLPNNVG